MQELAKRGSSNLLGVLSIVLSIVFWECATSPQKAPVPGSSAGPILVASALLALVGAVATGLTAGIRGSKWCLLSLLGPAFAAVLLWSSRT